MGDKDERRKRGSGIVKVSDLFAKYVHTLSAPQKTVIKAYTEAVFDTIGIRIGPEDCVYNVDTKILLIKTSGMIKSELRIQKSVILTRMSESIGKKNIPKDIL
jgi:hypothetical protein